MPVDVSPAEEEFPPGFDPERLARTAEAALRAAGRHDCELSIAIGDDGFITALNAEWRGTNEPTDVLSFPQLEGEELSAQGPLVLGDVAISAETAARQAIERGHDLDTELAVLLVHGLCHLLGHDHEDEAEARIMLGEEARILAEIRVDVAGLIERAHR